MDEKVVFMTSLLLFLIQLQMFSLSEEHSNLNQRMYDVTVSVNRSIDRSMSRSVGRSVGLSVVRSVVQFVG